MPWGGRARAVFTVGKTPTVFSRAAREVGPGNARVLDRKTGRANDFTVYRSVFFII